MDGLRSQGPLDVRALSFVCCTLAGLPYEVQEEPLFVVDYVNRQVGAEGGTCLGGPASGREEGEPIATTLFYHERCSIHFYAAVRHNFTPLRGLYCVHNLCGARVA